MTEEAAEIGDVIDGPAVPSHAMVRDGAGTFYVRRGRLGQVVRGAGSWRVWGEVKPFLWFERFRFELVALAVPETADREMLQRLGEDYERRIGVVELGDGGDGTEIPANAEECDG